MASNIYKIHMIILLQLNTVYFIIISKVSVRKEHACQYKYQSYVMLETFFGVYKLTIPMASNICKIHMIIFCNLTQFIL